MKQLSVLLPAGLSSVYWAFCIPKPAQRIALIEQHLAKKSKYIFKSSSALLVVAPFCWLFYLK